MSQTEPHPGNCIGEHPTRRQQQYKPVHVNCVSSVYLGAHIKH
jgi:hypothetical protein